ncbi:MAG: hypothetical protein ACXVMS_06965 [Flavisolibacter sp.]
MLRLLSRQAMTASPFGPVPKEKTSPSLQVFLRYRVGMLVTLGVHPATATPEVLACLL